MNKIYAYPTDTVWGIGAAVSSNDAHAHINLIKKIIEPKPFSVLFLDIYDLRSYINLPDEFSDEWLINFFSLQSSMVISREWLKKEMAPNVLATSDWVSCRVANSIALKHLLQSIGGPISSTSLNITGQAPIIKKSDAIKFAEKNKITFFEGDIIPSGEASTIICFKKNLSFEFWRDGILRKEIYELAKLLTT